MDLEGSRIIAKEEGKKLKESEKLDFFLEVSAKTGENIDKLFFQASRILYSYID